MLSRPHILALVAAGCMAAAGLGAYVAVRQNTAPVAAGPAVTGTAQPVETPVPGAVAETEAVVEPPAAEAPAPEAAPEPEPAPEPTPKPATRTPVRKVASAEPDPAPTPAAEKPLPVKGLEERWPPRAAEPPPPAIPVESGAPEGAGVPVALEPYVPPPVYEELVVSADSVLGLELESSVSSESARVEDPVDARLIRAVLVDGKVAVPAGARVRGSVTMVEPGGKVKERARLGVRFHTLVLADSTEMPIQTDGIYREGEPPSGDSVKKIGGAAVGGAILGAILGGTKGAAIGGATGAGAGTAVVMAGDRHPAVLLAGTTVTVRLVSPVTITIER